MTPPERRLIRDMIENAHIAMDSSRDVDAELFDGTPALKYTTLYALQIIGEAASKLSDTLKAAYPGVPWEEIVATRHLIAHGYDKVSPGAIIDIAQADLPPLIDALRLMLSREP